MGNTQFEVDDAIVLLLGAPTRFPQLEGRIDGITRLEKLLFLLEKESVAGRFLTEPLLFRAHHFGPFSERVYQAVELLKAAGLTEERGRSSSSGEESWEAVNIVGLTGPDAPYVSREFRLTPLGTRYYDALVKALDASVVQSVSAVKNQFAALPLRQLIRYVYQRFPEFTEKSKIKDEILG